MSRITDLRMGESIVVLAKSDTGLRGVELRTRGGAIECLWSKTGDTNENWLSFARQCQVPVGSGSAKRRSSKLTLALCVESIGVSFQEFAIPAVGPEETEAMVRMQAETRMPLPIEQMDIAWRVRPGEASENSVTLAAARKGLLQSVADQLTQIEPKEMVLEAEALVALWKHLCPRQGTETILIDVTSRRTLVCQVVEGALVHATVMDVGWEDIHQVMAPPEGAVLELSLEVLSPFEVFIQDLQAILNGYATADTAAPIYLSSDRREQMDLLLPHLDAHSLAGRALHAGASRLVTHSEAEVSDDILTYRLPLGAALACLDGSMQRLRLFDRFCTNEAHTAKKRQAMTPVTAATAALIAVGITLAGLYGIDVVKAQRLEALTASADLKVILQEKAHQKQIARQRFNFPALLQLMGKAESKGITLDSFHFKEGQAIRVEGRADQESQLHAFQKGLLDQRGIDKVLLNRSSFDKKTKKFEFTLTFHYKTFTLKSAKS